MKQFDTKQKTSENQHPASVNLNNFIDERNHINHPDTAIPSTLEKSHPESLNLLNSIRERGINARPEQRRTSHQFITSDSSSPNSLCAIKNKAIKEAANTATLP